MDLIVLEKNLVLATFWMSFISFLLFLTSVVTKKKDSEKAQVTSSLGYVGMILASLTSSGALVAKAVLTKHVPWSNFYESIVLMTALASIIFLIVHKVYKSDLLGVIMPPGITILIGIGTLLPLDFKGNAPLVPALQSYWIKIHVTAMIFSYSVFMLATTTAIAYLIAYYIAKGKNKDGGIGQENTKGKLSLASTGPPISDSNMAIVGNPVKNEELATAGAPSARITRSSKDELHQNNPHLSFLDELTYRLILLGFPILAFGIITGAMWANHAWGTYWSWDPKETSSLMSWLFYAAYIHTRVGMNVKGVKSSIIALVGFVAIIFTYYGVNFLPGLHSYGFSVD